MKLRFAFSIAALVATLAGGIAAAATVFNPSAADEFLLSSAPPLLAPIDARGRTGWDCEPEHAAESATWKRAQLPAPSAQ